MENTSETRSRVIGGAECGRVVNIVDDNNNNKSASAVTDNNNNSTARRNCERVCQTKVGAKQRNDHDERRQRRPDDDDQHNICGNYSSVTAACRREQRRSPTIGKDTATFLRGKHGEAADTVACAKRDSTATTGSGRGSTTTVRDHSVQSYESGVGTRTRSRSLHRDAQQQRHRSPTSATKDEQQRLGEQIQFALERLRHDCGESRRRGITTTTIINAVSTSQQQRGRRRTRRRRDGCAGGGKYRITSPSKNNDSGATDDYADNRRRQRRDGGGGGGGLRNDDDNGRGNNTGASSCSDDVILVGVTEPSSASLCSAAATSAARAADHAATAVPTLLPGNVSSQKKNNHSEYGKRTINQSNTEKHENAVSSDFYTNARTFGRGADRVDNNNGDDDPKQDDSAASNNDNNNVSAASLPRSGAQERNCGTTESSSRRLRILSSEMIRKMKAAPTPEKMNGPPPPPPCTKSYVIHHENQEQFKESTLQAAIARRGLFFETCIPFAKIGLRWAKPHDPDFAMADSDWQRVVKRLNANPYCAPIITPFDEIQLFSPHLNPLLVQSAVDSPPDSPFDKPPPEFKFFDIEEIFKGNIKNNSTSHILAALEFAFCLLDLEIVKDENGKTRIKSNALKLICRDIWDDELVDEGNPCREAAHDVTAEILELLKWAALNTYSISKNKLARAAADAAAAAGATTAKEDDAADEFENSESGYADEEDRDEEEEAEEDDDDDADGAVSSLWTRVGKNNDESLQRLRHAKRRDAERKILKDADQQYDYQKSCYRLQSKPFKDTVLCQYLAFLREVFNTCKPHYAPKALLKGRLESKKQKEKSPYRRIPPALSRDWRSGLAYSRYPKLCPASANARAQLCYDFRDASQCKLFNMNLFRIECLRDSVRLAHVDYLLGLNAGFRDFHKNQMTRLTNVLKLTKREKQILENKQTPLEREERQKLVCMLAKVRRQERSNQMIQLRSFLHRLFMAYSTHVARCSPLENGFGAACVLPQTLCDSTDSYTESALINVEPRQRPCGAEKALFSGAITTTNYPPYTTTTGQTIMSFAPPPSPREARRPIWDGTLKRCTSCNGTANNSAQRIKSLLAHFKPNRFMYDLKMQMGVIIREDPKSNDENFVFYDIAKKSKRRMRAEQQLMQRKRKSTID